MAIFGSSTAFLITGVTTILYMNELYKTTKQKAYITADEPLQDIEILNKKNLNQTDLKNQIKSFSQEIKNFPPEILASGSTVFAINAPWGGGKSSFIQITKEEILQTKKGKLIFQTDKNGNVNVKDFNKQATFIKKINTLLDTDILLDLKIKAGDTIWIDFNPWNFGNQTELLQNFFDTLDFEISKFYGDRFGTLLGKYVDLVSAEYEAKMPIEGLKIKAQKQLFGPQPLEKLKDEIKNRLRKINHKIIIVLDDIDRMSPDEVVFVLKLVKMISDFPQIIFILPMDYNKVAGIVEKKFGSGDGYKNYLQKIVQTVIRQEPLDEKQLQALFVWQVKKFFVDEIELVGDNWKNQMKKVFDYYHGKVQATGNISKAKIITPRDIKQLSNKIVKWFSSNLVNLESEEYKEQVQKDLEKHTDLENQVDELLQTQVFVQK